MKNYFYPEEEIAFDDMFFLCFIIERTARMLQQPNNYIVNIMGAEELHKKMSLANVLHCLDFDKVVREFVEEFNLKKGDYDLIAEVPYSGNRVPKDMEMGKVYAWLIDEYAKADYNGDYVEAMQAVYDNEVCKTLDDYCNGSYYEPSNCQYKAFRDGRFGVGEPWPLEEGEDVD